MKFRVRIPLLPGVKDQENGIIGLFPLLKFRCLSAEFPCALQIENIIEDKLQSGHGGTWTLSFTSTAQHFSHSTTRAFIRYVFRCEGKLKIFFKFLRIKRATIVVKTRHFWPSNNIPVIDIFLSLPEQWYKASSIILNPVKNKEQIADTHRL